MRRCERQRRNYILLEKELQGDDDEEEMVFTASGSPLHPTHVTSVCL